MNKVGPKYYSMIKPDGFVTPLKLRETPEIIGGRKKSSSSFEGVKWYRCIPPAEQPFLLDSRKKDQQISTRLHYALQITKSTPHRMIENLNLLI